jgi:hypothetical protein
MADETGIFTDEERIKREAVEVMGEREREMERREMERRMREDERRQRHREERGREQQRTDPNFTDRMLGLFNSIFKTYVKPELDETMTMKTRLQDKSFAVKLPVLALVFLFNSNLFFVLYLLSTINVDRIPDIARELVPTPEMRMPEVRRHQ